MSSDWAGYTGRQVGVWRLESLIRSSNGRADFIGSDGARQAWLQLIAADSPDAALAIPGWQSAQHLSNDHIVRIFESGDADLDGVALRYAALEPPDDDISEIISGRQLDAEEARSMLSAVASALVYLHGQELRHGGVLPQNMLICGEAVKLGVDRISPLGEDGRSADLKQLGQTLIRAMAGSADGVRRVASPFREIAAGCMDSAAQGWSAETVLSVLEGGKIPIPVPKPVPQLRRERGDGLPVRDISPGLNRKWPIGVAVAGVAVIGFLAYRSISDPAPAAVATSNSAPVVAAIPQSQKLTQHPALAEGTWAVVAATYGNFNAAEARAKKIGEKSPKLQVRVYPAQEVKGNRYFVVLGSAQNKDGAEKIRRLAKQQGAPRDTYVTKLKSN